MASGLIALLDDVVAIAKVAAASLDDTAAVTAKAAAKATGVVIDDAAVTPRYVTGFSPARELPIVFQIAKGSLRNKLLYLLPAGLLLSTVAPWAITPLLMTGGCYLCFEGAEKLVETWLPHESSHLHHSAPIAASIPAPIPADIEKTMVAGAIRTDLILSGEIMAITLATVADQEFVSKVIVLAVVGVLITIGVYGVVGIIVKTDDVGVALARSGVGWVRAVGRSLVRGMPLILKILAATGTAAMLWVGGGILLHGVGHYGFDLPARVVNAAAASAGRLAGPVPEWLVGAGAAAMIGVCIGALLVALSVVIAAEWRAVLRRA